MISPFAQSAAAQVFASGAVVVGAGAVAKRVPGFPRGLIPKRHLAKGNYFTITSAAPFSRLIYPLPVAGGLGTHYRRDLGGCAHFGA